MFLQKSLPVGNYLKCITIYHRAARGVLPTSQQYTIFMVKRMSGVFNIL
jgi:hypothetical protein